MFTQTRVHKYSWQCYSKHLNNLRVTDEHKNSVWIQETLFTHKRELNTIFHDTWISLETLSQTKMSNKMLLVGASIYTCPEEKEVD